jgi:hypothetical protein
MPEPPPVTQVVPFQYWYVYAETVKLPGRVQEGE